MVYVDLMADILCFENKFKLGILKGDQEFANKRLSMKYIAHSAIYVGAKC